MNERVDLGQLRFNHWGLAIGGAALFGALVIFLGWLDKRSVESELDLLRGRLCGNTPGELLKDTDKVSSLEPLAPADFAGIQVRVKKWMGKIGEREYGIQVYREERSAWLEVTWDEKWRTVREKPADDVLGTRDCSALVDDGEIVGARRYRGAQGVGFVVVATRRRN